jgi:hypothetical protein
MCPQPDRYAFLDGDAFAGHPYAYGRAHGGKHTYIHGQPIADSDKDSRAGLG